MPYTSITELLAEVAFLTFPIHLIHLIWNSYTRTYYSFRRSILAAATCISMVLMMCFPVGSFLPHQFYDMRQVPIILGSLYGGPLNTIVIFTLSIAAYSVLHGSTDLISSSLTNAVLLLPLLAYGKGMLNRSPSARILWASLLAAGGAIGLFLLDLTIDGHSFNLRFLGFFAFFTLIQVLLTLFSGYQIEITRNSAYLHEQLSEAERLKLISAMAASISHEVRNPLTVTKGFIQMLREESLSSDKKSMFISLALEELERAKTIIDDYLSFAKPDTHEEEWFNIREEAAYSIGVITPYALMGAVRIDSELKDADMFGYRAKMRQILINIIKNCIEAMPKGGVLDIHTFTLNGYACISIEDQGIGMDEDQLRQLGNAYFSTKPNGTGLGMLVVYRLIQSMKGRIAVTSIKGKGTHFLLTFPSEQKSAH